MSKYRIRSFFCSVIVLILVSFPSFVQAQYDIPYFQDFTLEEGLSSIDVIIYFQDSKGIIWLGTSYGLNRYDGTAIKSYTKEDNGLCHNYVQHIAEDGNGNLWIKGGNFGSTDHHFCILDPVMDRFYSIEDYTGEPCPFDTEQTRLFSNYMGTFLFLEITDDKFQFYEVQDDKIEKGFEFLKEESPLHVNLGFTAFKLDNETYIVSAGLKSDINKDVINRFWQVKQSGLIIDNFLEPNPYASSAIGTFLSVTSEHKLSYEFSDGLDRIIQKTYYMDEKFMCTFIQDNFLNYSLFEQGKVYSFYEDHIGIFNPVSDSLIPQQTINLEERTILKKRPFFDRSGNIWFRRVNEITKLSFQPQNFKSYLVDKVDNLPIPVRGIDSSPDGDLYVGDPFYFHEKALDDIELNNIFRNKYGASILGILYDDDKVWVATEFLGLAMYSFNTKALVYYGKGLIWQPYKAVDGTIWVGAGQGLFKLDLVKKELLPLLDYGEYTELEKSSVYAFHHNEKGTWLSTSTGMYLVDLDQEKVLSHYSNTQADPYYIPANHIAHIHEDKEGIFWLASKGQGLVRWNPTTGKSEQLTKGNTGLSHNVIYAVYEDDFDNLWLPSNYGLNCLNKTTRQVSLYLQEDGLPHHEFNTISHHQDQKGNLYFGTVDGMIEFHPNDFNQEGENIPLILTGVNRINKKTDTLINMTRSVIDNHSLILKPQDKAADFTFALLDYKKSKGNQYSYKIEGYKEDWIFQKEASLRISGLPYGNYQLLIRGKVSGSNNWIEYPHAIKIYVVKPFYLQWWFVLSCLLAMVGGVFLVFKRNTRRLLARQLELETIVEERTEKIRLQSEELKELDKVKSNFFANISHELRTPLTLILGPLSYILDNPEEWEKENIQKQLLVMQRNGKSLIQLIEEILDLSKLEANKLELHEEGTPVIPFFENLFFVFEPQFQSQGLEYDLIFNIKEDLNIMMDRKKMEKVLNNFLSNAIKFTNRDGKIILDVTAKDGQLEIKITDNGKGIHPNDLPFIFERFYQSKQGNQVLYGGTGIGLALVNEFAQLMGGKAYAESTLGKGSNFYFELPIKEVSQEKMLKQFTIADLSEDEEIYAIGSDFTILIVEDNHDMQTFIHQLLQPKYQNILLANNGLEGLNALKEHGTAIDLIISDVMMPELDGLGMLKEIKSHSEWYGIPVVMLTALADERDKLSALTIGVDDYLTKPFSVPELLIRVQNLLFNYHQRKEWIKSSEFQEKDNQPLDKGDTEITINEQDKDWLDDLNSKVLESMEDAILDVEGLAAAVYITSRQLNRKLKAITGLSPVKFIKEVQLQAARKILERGTFISISEVAHKSGFEHQSTFSRVFKNRFGKKPSEYSR